MDEDLTKTVFNKSKLKKMFTSILQDPQMTQQFVIQASEDKPEINSQKSPLKIIDEQPVRQSIEKQESKNNVSRLEIEIQKNSFNLTPQTGEVFFLLIEAYLEGKASQQKGKIMLTNYRVLFFKDNNKRVDLPFGLISKVQYVDKQARIIYKLKYPHLWKFTIANTSKYQQFKNVGNIYYKTNEIKKMFAFQYALKLIPIPQPYSFSLSDEYRRLKFDKHPKGIISIVQEKYSFCSTYPSQIYANNFHDIKTIALHRRNKRVPILAYDFVSLHSKVEVPLWITSSYEDIKSINKSSEKQFLKSLRGSQNLQIFVIESKNSKHIDEQHFDKNIPVNYLKLQSNQQLRQAEKSLFEVFLSNKKPFIKEILNTKWYSYIANILNACQIIRNIYLQQNAIMIRCESGYDKSIVLASMVQIIMDPYFRTFKGFQSLIMRMFVHNGHPFAERLGLRENDTYICPIFLQFLDCVSQLINQNPSSFEYNFKYLSKISNQMQVNIYGTFLANSSKQYKQSRIQIQTSSIWLDLINPITTNGFYDKKGGVLELSSSISSIRIWKQHFGDMISRNKDHYCFEEIAEDNDDYLNLYCLRLKEENVELMIKMKQKMSIIQRLQRQLKEKQSK